MPILHLQLQAQIKSNTGSLISVPPEEVMQGRGPCVQVSVNIAQSMGQPIASMGGTLPAPISGWGLIDTGASSTCIDEGEAQKLGLPAIDVVPMASASHSLTMANVYALSIEIAGLPIAINVPRAIGAALSSQGLLLLIGRDLLRHCTLFYNGLTGEITISI